MSFTYNATNTKNTFFQFYTWILPTRWHSMFQTGIWGQAVKEQVQSALRGKWSASGVNRALCLPLHVPSLLLAAKPGGTASPVCCSAGRGPSTGGWRHAVQASHVLAAHVALKAQRQDGGREGGGAERRSSNASGLILQPRLSQRHYRLRGKPLGTRCNTF